MALDIDRLEAAIAEKNQDRPFSGAIFIREGGETRLSPGARPGVRLRIMRAVSLRVPLARDKSFLEVNSRNNRPEVSPRHGAAHDICHAYARAQTAPSWPRSV